MEKAKYLQISNVLCGLQIAGKPAILFAFLVGVGGLVHIKYRISCDKIYRFIDTLRNFEVIAVWLTLTVKNVKIRH